MPAETPEIERLTFRVPHMDCAAEEQLVRMKLADAPGVRQLQIDIPARTVVVLHHGDGAAIERAMGDLGLGAALAGRDRVAAHDLEPQQDDAQQRRLLIVVLAINAALFFLELGTGLVAHSLGLVSDSLDMLADAIVYALSLYAVGHAASHKLRVARLSGYFQLGLALLGLAEVMRRFLGMSEQPDFLMMIVISLVAFAGNVTSLLVLRRGRRHEAHMRASWIFTSNDVLVNLGVVAAGVLVLLTGSRLPDLLIGAVVFGLVIQGAVSILRIKE